MPYLAAGTVLVGLLGLVNLVLTFGVIRRLRDVGFSASALARKPMLSAGEPVGEFEIVTTDGTPISRDSLGGDTVVGFFSTGCAPCEQLLPAFLQYAAAMPGGRERVLAVVVGPEGDVVEPVARLAPVSRVVVEDITGGPLSSAFGVLGYPSVCVVDGAGRVAASGSELRVLPEPARV
ncbi:TlpA disulfide reductase family protein [Actinophytocola sp.]|uniref:TlpA family protein disulfide reductase n=1 Tax=Actinophytocola sp. TaxID=1872138 RepID=UPI002ED633B7